MRRSTEHYEWYFAPVLDCTVRVHDDRAVLDVDLQVDTERQQWRPMRVRTPTNRTITADTDEFLAIIDSYEDSLTKQVRALHRDEAAGLLEA